MSDKIKHLLILSTCPSSDTAKKIANELIAEHLSACVQIIPGVQSFFHWDGKVDNAEEHLLLIKTSSERYKALEDRIKSLHPYELPEIIAVPISTGSTEYMSWIDRNTQP